MLGRALILSGGIVGALGAAQFPEFSQQYVQRLGGAVDALSEVVADFDASAAAEGLTRNEALAQMQGTEFLERRQADMARTFQRHAELGADLALLERHGPFMRAYHAARFTDRDVARAALSNFEPALPITPAGLTFAGLGGLGGLAIMQSLLACLRWPFSRRRAA